ncbi:hypothetical protein FHG66_04640 [Rubellimicrobium rubrum]|uniref:Peptidase inhibitor I78 n=1 Tax=Rubellimicrobium rubrum TaxID=2585369 RepID=A0A5C4MYZ4_9RHOB|nr:I78 family peptidase inhibitor [Rubellimicrobium rubrum]TNC51463.1 hypothetical protein FHG66_04640 [Rubellimicrobium rubrum]
MSPFRRAAPLFLALLLAACETTPASSVATSPADEEPPLAGEPLGDMPAPVLPSPADDTCGASGLADFIGEDAGVTAATTFQNPIRIIRPGDMVTMDFSPERLNFELDELNEIIRVRCG